jgi:hypothetical protein
MKETTTIKPNQIESIHEHVWRDKSIVRTLSNGKVLGVYVSDLTGLSFDKDDAIAIAKHFNLLPVFEVMTETEYLSQGKNGKRLKESITQYDRGEAKEYLNSELVVNIDTGPDLKIGGAGGLEKFNGFMSEDRE